MQPSQDPATAAEKVPLRLVAALIVATLALYAVCAGFGYTGWDDEAYITVNPMLESGAGLVEMWTTDRLEQYYPLTFTLYWLEFQLWGRDPAGYHVVNVLVHALNVGLVLLLLRRLGASLWVAAFSAAFFAFHPLQAMSVAWVAERKNLLSLSFGILSLLAWLRFRREERLAWYVAALAAFAAALMSKTAILGLPVLLVVVDAAFLGRRWQASLRPVAPFLLLSAGFAAITFHFEEKFLGTMPEPALRPLIAATGVWFYLGKILLPLDLLPIYPLWDVSLGDPVWWLPLAAMLAAGVLLWTFRRRCDRWTLFGLMVFFLFLGPTSGLFAFGNLTVTFVSDHYVYVPLIGVCVVLLTPLERWMQARRERRTAVTALLFAVLLFQVILTARYLPAYDDARSMWTHTLEGNPDAFPAHMGLGIVAKREGEWPRAAQHFWRAWKVLPEESEARLEMADALLRSGDLPEARREFEALSAAGQGGARPAFGLGSIAERERRFDDALTRYREGVARAETDTDRAWGLAAEGRLHLGLGRRAEAAAAFAEAWRLDPADLLSGVGLAAAQRGLGQVAAAIATLEAVLDRDADRVAALTLLARILATTPDDALRDGTRALALAERARELAPATDLPPIEALAAARAEVGRFADAASLLEAAAKELAEGVPGLAQRLRRQAGAYRRKEALREPASETR